MSRQNKLPQSAGLKLCDCGRTAVRRAAGAWQCARCLSIKMEDYHQINIAPEKLVKPPSANRLMEEWKAGNFAEV